MPSEISKGSVSTSRVALGDDHSHAGFLQHVGCQTPDKQFALLDVSIAALVTGLGNAQCADIEAAGAPGELGADIQVHGPACIAQADASGEEGNAVAVVVVAALETECEDVGILQEKIPFLRKKCREPGQVHLPVIHFRVREIRIERQHPGQRGRDVVEKVQRRVRVGGLGRRHVVPAAAHIDRRDNVQALALLKAGEAGVIDPELRRPAIRR